jgi:AcrR family transcriptional regulator
MSPQQPPRSSPGRSSDPPPLPRGRHRLPFEFVVENQRRRLIAGAARALAEHGYTALTVRHVVEAAGVSRATFYANFDDKHECILVAHQQTFDRLLSCIVRACATEREWSAKVRAAMAASLSLIADEPCAARLLTLDALAADLVLARRAIDSNAHLAALLRDGRNRTPLGPALPDLTEEALIGAVSAIVGGRLLDGDVETLSELEPELLQLVLTPYIGVQEAARVASADS